MLPMDEGRGDPKGCPGKVRVAVPASAAARKNLIPSCSKYRKEFFIYEKV